MSLSAYNNGTRRQNLFNQTDLIFSPRTGGIGHTLLAGVELGRQETDNLRTTGFFTSLGPNVTSVSVPLGGPTTSLPLSFRPSATDADNHGVAEVAAAYVQDQIVFSPHAQAIVGLRYDRFTVDFRNDRTGADLRSEDVLVSPRLGLVYKPIVPVSIYATYSVSYLPRAGEQLSSLSPTNQAFEPERFQNYELGAKWDIARALSVTAAAYRLDRGNEDGRITRSISATAEAGARLAQLPDHTFSLWNKYDLSARWGVGLGLIHRSEIFTSTDDTVILPGFTRVDAAVYFSLGRRLRAQANLENLLDESYYASVNGNNNITPGSPRAVRVAVTGRF